MPLDSAGGTLIARPWLWRSDDAAILSRQHVEELQRRVDALTRLRAAISAYEDLKRLHSRTHETQRDALPPLGADPLRALKTYYKCNPVQFISDWGMTYDPRNIEVGLSPIVPFILYPRQVEWCFWVLAMWRSRTPGVCEKAREMGVTWLAIALSSSLCLHFDGMSIGFGSRKEEYVDKLGDYKSIFHKGREFLRMLPVEFRGGWTIRDHAPHMRILIPDTGAAITGEAGDNIGRGDRKSIYFVDEAAHLEHPLLVDAALSQTTNCQIDMSSVNGLANAFAEKRHSGRVDVFEFAWQDDPRKDQVWYDKQVRELDPVIVAQEIDRSYTASSEGIVIPASWAMSCLDAHLKLDVQPTGQRGATLDIADEGRDKNAVLGGYGILVEHVEEWSGRDSDTFASTERALGWCESRGFPRLRYDADGLGASVRGDARVLNEKRVADKLKPIPIETFRGSGAVLRPESEDVKGRRNEDFFANRKAQAWWTLRERMRMTHRAVTEGAKFDRDRLVSISSGFPLHRKLITELSQATYALNASGKVVIDKTPDGALSPNLADCAMMYYSAPFSGGLNVSREALAQI